MALGEQAPTAAMTSSAAHHGTVPDRRAGPSSHPAATSQGSRPSPWSPARAVRRSCDSSRMARPTPSVVTVVSRPVHPMGVTISVAAVTSSKVFGAGTSKLVPLAATVLAGSAFGLIFRVFLRQRDVLFTLVVLVAVGAVAAVPLARRWGRPLPLVLLAFWGLAVIPAFTLVPDLGYSQYGRALWRTSRISLEHGGRLVQCPRCLGSRDRWPPERAAVRPRRDVPHAGDEATGARCARASQLVPHHRDRSGVVGHQVRHARRLRCQCARCLRWLQSQCPGPGRQTSHQVTPACEGDRPQGADARQDWRLQCRTSLVRPGVPNSLQGVGGYLVPAVWNCETTSHGPALPGSLADLSAASSADSTASF